MKRRWSKHKNDQMLLFLHGPGGSGKSTVIDTVLMYCKEYYELLDQPFTNRTVVVSAMSGVAATLIMGETTHKALHLNRKKEFTEVNRDEFQDTKLIIIDEMSFTTEQDLEKAERNLRQLKQRIHDCYGGVNMVFSGDFRQLEPVNGVFLYDTDCTKFAPLLNMFIELNGLHRFSNDPNWGKMLRRFRNGCPTKHDIDTLNRHCIYDCNTTQLVQDIRYATSRNKDRDAINVASFEKRCLSVATPTGNQLHVPDSLLVLSDNLQLGNATKHLSDETCRTFWQECGEDDIKMDRGRMDPVLRLYPQCPVMMTHNENVAGGEANGTCATVVSVSLKHNETTKWIPMKIDSTTVHIQAAHASQIKHITLKHCNDRVQPEIFHLEPKNFSFNANLPQPRILGFDAGRRAVKMKALQLPIVSNTATTGHKLQGSSLHNLFVHEWNKTHKNWPYVVLSRVRTMNGLVFRKALPHEQRHYQLCPNYVDFLHQMKAKAPSDYTDNMTDEELLHHFNYRHS